MFSTFRSQGPRNFQHVLPANRTKCKDRGVSCLKWQTGALVPSDVMDTRHPQSPVWPSTSFHTDAPCTGLLRAKSKQQSLWSCFNWKRLGCTKRAPFIFVCIPLTYSLYKLQRVMLGDWNAQDDFEQLEAADVSRWDAGLCACVWTQRLCLHSWSVCKDKRCVPWELTFNPSASGVTVHLNRHHCYDSSTPQRWSSCIASMGKV